MLPCLMAHCSLVSGAPALLSGVMRYLLLERRHAIRIVVQILKR